MSVQIKVLKADITKVNTDAIVNAADSSLTGGGGVDGAIHRAGGRAILEACKKIVARQGGCKTGEALITTGGNLPAEFVIHTVGPVWSGGNRNERALLANCYQASLQLAIDNGCRTIAFPAISTGVYRFPKKEAAAIAVQTVNGFLRDRTAINDVLFVCFDDENVLLIEQELRHVNRPS